MLGKHRWRAVGPEAGAHALVPPRRRRPRRRLLPAAGRLPALGAPCRAAVRARVRPAPRLPCCSRPLGRRRPPATLSRVVGMCGDARAPLAGRLEALLGLRRNPAGRVWHPRCWRP